jgi:type VI secretion system protein ImpK
LDAQGHAIPSATLTRKIVGSLAGLIERAQNAAFSAAVGIRDLLRDTALLDSRLSIDNAVTTLRTECDATINQFGAARVLRGYSGDILQDARIAHCACSIKLHCKASSERTVTTGHRDRYRDEVSQHDASERVFERLDERMRERAPKLDLLQFYAAIRVSVSTVRMQ